MKRSLSRNDIVKKDKRYVWHPYTQMKEYVEELDPLVLSGSEGIYLYDKSGKRYIDGNSSWWVNNLGHANPRLIKILKMQADKLAHCALAGITHEGAALLGERLCNFTSSAIGGDGRLSKVFYSDDGSTAVEVALKMSFQYWQQNGYKGKKNFVTFKGAFHGETIGAVSVGGIELFHKIFSPLLFNSIQVPSPNCYRCPVGESSESCGVQCFLLMEKVLREKADEVAAVVIEPIVQGAAGMVIYPSEYLRRLRSLTTELDIFLIADEVFTGFGRTGKIFACSHASISPDFLCLSKGITGGTMPFAATLATDRIYEGFYGSFSSNKTFYYGHSYCGNPLGTALALEVIDIFEDEDIINKIRPVISVFQSALKRFLDIPFVGDIRHIGMVGAVEIVRDRKTKMPFPPEKRFGRIFYEEALGMGAYLRPLGDIIYFVPPLIIKEHEIRQLVDIAYDAAEKAFKKVLKP